MMNACHAPSAAENAGRTHQMTSAVIVSITRGPMDRPCGPGLTATATGAARIVIDGINIVLAGDQEDICGLQNSYPRGKMNPTDSATKALP